MPRCTTSFHRIRLWQRREICACQYRRSRRAGYVAQAGRAHGRGLFTAGTYAFIDAEYARITLREAPSVASSIVESARVQLAAVAANPPRALTDLFARLARAVNTRVNTFVYSIAFPESLVPRYAADAPSGVVSVRVSAGKAPVPTAPVSSLANATTSPMPRIATTQAQSAGEQSTGGVTSRQVIEPPSAQGYGGAQRVIEQRIVSAGGISEEILNARLQQLDNKLMSLIYGASSAPGPVTYVSTPPPPVASRTTSL